MKKLAFIVPLLGIFWSGCAVWTIATGKYVSTRDNYEVEVPEGWRKHNWGSNNLRLTRDGETLQIIRIERLFFDKDPPHTKRKLTKGMLPQEVAEVVIDDFRSSPNITDYRIIENAPAKVGGQPGFRIVYTYKTKTGLTRKGAYYGVLVNDWYYYLVFEAPARYYFPRDDQTFEKLKETFKITATS